MTMTFEVTLIVLLVFGIAVLWAFMPEQARWSYLRFLWNKRKIPPELHTWLTQQGFYLVPSTSPSDGYYIPFEKKSRITSLWKGELVPTITTYLNISHFSGKQTSPAHADLEILIPIIQYSQPWLDAWRQQVLDFPSQSDHAIPHLAYVHQTAWSVKLCWQTRPTPQCIDVCLQRVRDTLPGFFLSEGKDIRLPVIFYQLFGLAFDGDVDLNTPASLQEDLSFFNSSLHEKLSSEERNHIIEVLSSYLQQEERSITWRLEEVSNTTWDWTPASKQLLHDILSNIVASLQTDHHPTDRETRKN